MKGLLKESRLKSILGVFWIVNFLGVLRPPGTEECLYECGQGTCVAGACECPDFVFGRQCDKESVTMEDSVLQKQVVMPPFSAFHFEENVNLGEKDITFNLVSPAKPKLTMLVNESPQKNYYFMMRREKGTTSSVLLQLPNLIFGEEEKIITAEKDWIYATVFNHEPEEVTVQFSVQSKPRLTV